MILSMFSVTGCLRLAAWRCAEAVLATAVLGSPDGFAQSTNYTSIEAVAGRPLQLTYHATAHKEDCAPAPLPEIRALEPPQHGLLTVRRAKLATDLVVGCPNLTLPAEVVFYTGRDGYSGADHLRYQITDINGETDIFDVAITVKGPTSDPPAPAGSTNSTAMPSPAPVPTDVPAGAPEISPVSAPASGK